jgi:DNA repair exonuclease SbcCD ATPase subunit
MKTQDLRNVLEQRKGKKAQVLNTIEALAVELRQKKKSLRRHEEAREIVRLVGIETQKQLQAHISDISSLALDAVFPDPYELIAEFVQRRNKTECDLYFVRDGEKVDPLEATGFGAVDVASFALRVASWAMEDPKLRNVIILDEPFKFLSEDHQEDASIMLKQISKKLGIQFIIVTHEQILTTYADRIFSVKLRRRKSKITVS